MKKRIASKEWGKIMPIRDPKIRYRKSDDVEWMFETLGWKKDARRT